MLRNKAQFFLFDRDLNLVFDIGMAPGSMLSRLLKYGSVGKKKYSSKLDLQWLLEDTTIMDKDPDLCSAVRGSGSAIMATKIR